MGIFAKRKIAKLRINEAIFSSYISTFRARFIGVWDSVLKIKHFSKKAKLLLEVSLFLWAVSGGPVMKVLETGFEMVQTIRKEGVAGLWEHLKDQFADLKETVMDAIMDIIQSQVIQAGIKWIMGLLIPVGAFVKAAMAIIDVVKFFIQRAAQIMELVKAFTESVVAIASGKVGAVAKAIENALGKSIPVLIGFLASLLGIGGLADKVIGVIKKIRERIINAITKLLNVVKAKVGNLEKR